MIDPSNVIEHPLYYWILGALVGWSAKGLYHSHKYRDLFPTPVALPVATELARQSFRRLDEREQRRAVDDAELELMSKCDVDVEIDLDGFAAYAEDSFDSNAEIHD